MANGIIQQKAAHEQSANAMQEIGKQSVSTMLSSILDGEKMRKRFDEILGKRTPQFLSSLTAMINGTPELQKCFFESPMSVIQSALKAASFDLPIDQSLGYAYIVPFRNKKKAPDGSMYQANEATFILGWKGMHQLALRTGAYKTINVVDIREGELRRYNRLTEEFDLEFIEDEDQRAAAQIVGYLGYYRLVNGAEKSVYMTKKQIEAHEQRFRKGQYMSKGWRDDFDAMARKTIYRQLIGKWGVMSIEYQDSKAGAALADQLREEDGSEEFGRDIITDARPEDGGQIIDEQPDPFDPDKPITGAPF